MNGVLSFIGDRGLEQPPRLAPLAGSRFHLRAEILLQRIEIFRNGHSGGGGGLDLKLYGGVHS